MRQYRDVLEFANQMASLKEAAEKKLAKIQEEDPKAVKMTAALVAAIEDLAVEVAYASAYSHATDQLRALLTATWPIGKISAEMPVNELQALKGLVQVFEHLNNLTREHLNRFATLREKYRAGAE